MPSFIKHFTCLLFLCLSLTARAQLQDDFADGNFSTNPVWSGMTSEFNISSTFQLQSNGDTTSASNREIYLSTASTAINASQWEFFVDPKVSTSSNNRMDVFLCSSDAVLNGTNTGYFVRIGGTPDEVALFRKDGLGVEAYVIQGTTGVINSSSSNPTKVKVTRDAAGNWTLYADYNGTGALYELVGTAQDVTYTNSAFFGVVVRYSSANRQKYYADNFYVGPIIVDNVAPSIQSIKVIDAHSLEVSFSESVSQVTAEETANYLVNNGIGEPSSAIRSATSFSKVTLSFIPTFQEGIENLLTVTAVEDLSGNDMNPQSAPFLYYKAKPYDVVINEIMADPDPSAGLPTAEYIELKNRTSYPILLENWMIEANTNRKVIPAIILQPDSFLVLTGTSGYEYYFDSLAVVEVTSFPALTNSGARISLYDADTVVISSVTYSDSWYNDSFKAQGGYSLEQLSSQLPCAGAENWTGSNSLWGGTPGKRNSVANSNSDTDAPSIDRVVVLANDTIRVFFSESILNSSSQNLSAYSINQGIGQPSSIGVYAPDFRSVKLSLSSPLQAGILYTISISNVLSDCVGNSFNVNSTGRFAIPETALANDIAINEILSNEKDGASDWVEVYNRSSKIIDLAQLQLSNFDSLTNVVVDVNPITEDGYLLFPGEYVVLTDDIAGVKNFYSTSNPQGFLQMSGFPTMSNDDGTVALSRIADFFIIDRMNYTTSMHFSLLNDLDGVSLERVNFDRPALDKSNWNSASSNVGYGTPAYRNSQFSASTEAQAGSVVISPEVFSPDGDGMDDVVTFAYAFDTPGYTGTLSIYDSNGRLVKYLGRNLLLGTNGQLSWNGMNEENEKARLGIYVFVMDAFTLDGKTSRIKKAFVLGGKL
ncbi:MAG: hypothetical protein RLZZ543_973 [Bacteroidota bacterium]|jgi:hypothetical protein